MISVLARNWWAFVLRGLVAILFGVMAFLLPGAAILSLVFLFAVYAAVDGILAITAAVRAAGKGERWGLLLLEGVAGIAFAVLSAMMPGLTAVLFVGLVGAWALITGGLMLMASFKVDANHGRWWLALGGLVSLLYGAALFLMPLAGVLVLTWWIGAYAIVFGVAMIMFGLRLKGLHGGLLQRA